MMEDSNAEAISHVRPDRNGSALARRPSNTLRGRIASLDLAAKPSANENTGKESGVKASVAIYNDSESEESSHQSRLKRQAEDAGCDQPFKRLKGSINQDYLDLLNRDIDDAVHRVCLDDINDVPSSQIGLTIWSSLEKLQFFEALARMGKQNIASISSRIGTKSPVEVQHYLNFLQKAVEVRSQLYRRSYLEPAEFPAAAEISPQCCHAQDEVADAISFRIERREEAREEVRWGQYWDITPKVATTLENNVIGLSASSRIPAFAQLFHVSQWLELSQRIYMNSSIPSSNWNFIDTKPPSIWATAFDDFRSLVLSFTRRLVQTTIFISMSRIRAKSEYRPRTQKVVRQKDVEAALASLGVAVDPMSSWAEAARRLRLEVYEEPPECHEDIEEDPLTYDEVEAELFVKRSVQSTAAEQQVKVETLSEDSSTDEDDVVPDSDDDDPPEDDEALAVDREVNEILDFTATSIRNIRYTRDALRRRVRIEWRQKEQADRRDQYMSQVAEAEIWNILQKQPPSEFPRRLSPGPAERSSENLEGIYSMGQNWAERLQYFEEWEVPSQGRKSLAIDLDEDDETDEGGSERTHEEEGEVEAD